MRALEINERLARHNELTVLTGNFPGARNENINGVQYFRIGSRASYLLSRITFTLFIVFHIRKFNVDIVINDCSYFAPCFASLYTKIPCVNIIHHLMGRHSFKIYFLFGLLPFTIEKIFLKTFKNIVTPSKGVKFDIQNGYQGKNIIDIPNGVSDALFDLEPKEKKFILFLGRIDIYMKGLDILLESFSLIRNRNISLKIAGSGKKGDMRKVTKLIYDLKLEERVEFLGRVNEQEKLELLRTCLFVVMPSRFEGWGIVALEANAAGKPVIGTTIKGLSEAVEPGKTALLVEPEDIEKLTAAMDLLIKKSDLRAALGRKGRAWAQKFSWESIAQEQCAFYKSLVKR